MPRSMTEVDVAFAFDATMEKVVNVKRCKLHKEVYISCFIDQMQPLRDLRIDRLALLDGALVGFELKAPPNTQADVGKHLFQCVQYANGVVSDKNKHVESDLVGRPLYAVFYVSDFNSIKEAVWQHVLCAQRLFGPARVGFYEPKENTPYAPFRLYMSGHPAWDINRGWHHMAASRRTKAGSRTEKRTDIYNNVTYVDDLPVVNVNDTIKSRSLNDGLPYVARRDVGSCFFGSSRAPQS